jgi:hypothetical protein
MPVAAGARQDTWKITVAVQLTAGAALTNLGTFDTYSGGETTATDTKHRPGGAPFEVSYGGPATRGNVTVSRVFNAVKGDASLLKRLDAVAGRGKASVSRQPLDGDGIVFGETIVVGGTLIRVTGPAADSNASGTAMLELEISTSGSLG